MNQFIWLLFVDEPARIRCIRQETGCITAQSGCISYETGYIHRFLDVF